MSFLRTRVDHIVDWMARHPLMSRLTVTKKIVAAYLLMALFSLIAIVYALGSLHQQMTLSTDLVHKDAKSVALSRELQANLASQERLGKQFLATGNQEAIDLMRDKYEHFPRLWSDFLPLLQADLRESLADYYRDYRAEGNAWLDMFGQAKAKAIEDHYYDKTLPAHLALYETLGDFRMEQQVKIDAALKELSRDSGRAFQVTLLLMLFGLILATPVALSVIISIHHSLRQLTRATLQVAEANYDIDISLDSRDEFGQLASEFLEMSRKLQEFEVSNLDANPLTHLPGNLVIQRRVEELLRDGASFAHAFVDLDHFKAYNDRYGYQNGSDIISEVGVIIERVVAEEGNENDFVGHIGGDDYIFLTSPDKVERISARIIDEFEAMIPGKYSDDDRRAGFFVSQDRFGVERQFPLMTISIAIICTDMSNYDSAIAISHECAKMKEHLKRLPGSNYLVDRRRGKS